MQEVLTAARGQASGHLVFSSIMCVTRLETSVAYLMSGPTTRCVSCTQTPCPASAVHDVLVERRMLLMDAVFCGTEFPGFTSPLYRQLLVRHPNLDSYPCLQSAHASSFVVYDYTQPHSIPGELHHRFSAVLAATPYPVSPARVTPRVALYSSHCCCQTIALLLPNSCDFHTLSCQIFA
jgi:hypothetical protein